MVHAVQGVRASEAAANQATAAQGSEGFLGADGLTWRDVVDTLNPLEHIPFISTLFNEMTGHTPSAASQLAGGALIGGPLGFLASIANVIFQDQTGKGVGGSMLAALTGEEAEASTQLASLEAPAAVGADADLVTNDVVARDLPAAAVPSPAGGRAVLDLYGSSPASAHSSYKKAQLRPYLQDVNVSKVL